MKKFILAITALLTTMLMIAQPLFVHAEGDEIPETTHLEELEQHDGDIPSRPAGKIKGYERFRNQANPDPYFVYVVIKQKYASIDNYHELYLSFEEGEATFENGVLTISNADRIGTNNQNLKGYYNREWWVSNANVYSDDYDGNHTFTSAELDFTNKSFIVYDGSAVRCNLNTSDNNYVTGTYNIYSNIPEMLTVEPTLNLQVTFSPSMSGTVTRQGTSNGADITYNYLNLNIKNNGDNAQWLFCIVPHGQSLSFPNAILNTPQGFIGSPTFVWVCDEWIDWTNGLTGITGNYGGIDMQMLYAPCAWHTLITGSDRTYRINWDMMKLTKDVSYDCVVYGMINEEPVNASDSGTGLGCWTVKSALSGITEVYRSTFNMPNPPEFNPDSIDEGNSAHAWNPDIDNSSLFNHGSVYKDANGNLVIKGSGGITNGTEWELGHHSGTGANINVYKAYGGFFGWFKGLLGILPTEYNLLILFGLTGMIAIGIIKAVK